MIVQKKRLNVLNYSKMNELGSVQEQIDTLEKV